MQERKVSCKEAKDAEAREKSRDSDVKCVDFQHVMWVKDGSVSSCHARLDWDRFEFIIAQVVVYPTTWVYEKQGKRFVRNLLAFISSPD